MIRHALALIALSALLVACGAEEAAKPDANPHPVAGNFSPDDTRLEECSDRPCLEQAFGNVSFEEGPRRALTLFDARIASDREVEAGCHRIAHSIGSAALARYDGNVARAFAEGSSSCWSGYYHGILERALIGTSSKAELITVTRRLCADEGVRRNTFVLYQCVHGIGHGLMIHSGLNLPLSLEICEQQQTAWDQTSCDGGVFMENFNSSYGVQSKFLKEDDLVYPCNAVKERHKLYCYLQVTDRLLGETGYDWKRTADACARVERNWRATCFQSYGRSASGIARLDAGKLLETCAIVEAAWRGECIFGAVRDITSNDAGAARAGRFCERVETSLRSRCFNGAGTILADLEPDPARRRTACAAITQRYLEQCLLRAS
ncbi:MAG: hypothetical protein ACRDN6_14120 [Gaiellaceae bacterium]